MACFAFRTFRFHIAMVGLKNRNDSLGQPGKLSCANHVEFATQFLHRHVSQGVRKKLGSVLLRLSFTVAPFG